MKIIRDGKEIELTSRECYAIYNEVFTDILRQDIIEEAERLGYTPTTYQLEEMVESAKNALDSCDPYWDVYWNVCEHTIEKVMTRKKNEDHQR